MFENLKNKMLNIKFDEWKYGCWFKVGLFDFLNITEPIEVKGGKYYRFLAILDEDNPFRVDVNLIVNLDISQTSFDNEILRHINFNNLPLNKVDLVMEICRINKNKIKIRKSNVLQHITNDSSILDYFKDI